MKSGCMLCWAMLLSSTHCLQHAVINLTFSSFDAAGASTRDGILVFSLGKTTDNLATAAALVHTDGLRVEIMPDAFSAPRAQMAAVTDASGVVLFAGGEQGLNKTKSNVIDSFNSTSGRFSTLRPGLSTARSFLAAATVGQYTLFGGGEIEAGVQGTDSAAVDIWDAEARRWATALGAGGQLLSHPRKKLAACSAGKWALFAGGYTSGEKNETTSI